MCIRKLYKLEMSYTKYTNRTVDFVYISVAFFLYVEKNMGSVKVITSPTPC